MCDFKILGLPVTPVYYLGKKILLVPIWEFGKGF